MPRKTRMYLPGIPAHVVQRGNNRDACFFCDDDYLFYKELLKQGLHRYGGQLHAYCLMTNHVHLLITPKFEDSISRIVQHVGRQYVHDVNKYYQRSGTLWKGRHKGSLVDADNYLLVCYRYIELNPVTAGMVETADQYSWSGYRCNAWGERDELIMPHELYLLCGVDDERRQCNYRNLFKTAIPNVEVDRISDAISRNYPTGSERVKGQIEVALGRKLGTGLRGRPKKKA